MNSVREVLSAQADVAVAASYMFIDQVVGLYVEAGQDAITIGHTHGVVTSEIEDIINLTVEQVVRGLISPEQGAQIIFDYAYEIIAGS
jgi:hypothetical protein